MPGTYLTFWDSSSTVSLLSGRDIVFESRQTWMERAMSLAGERGLLLQPRPPRSNKQTLAYQHFCWTFTQKNDKKSVASVAQFFYEIGRKKISCGEEGQVQEVKSGIEDVCCGLKGVVLFSSKLFFLVAAKTQQGQLDRQKDNGFEVIWHEEQPRNLRFPFLGRLFW